MVLFFLLTLLVMHGGLSENVSIGSGIRTRSPQLTVLFWGGYGTLLGKACHWRWALSTCSYTPLPASYVWFRRDLSGSCSVPAAMPPLPLWTLLEL